MYIQEWEWNIRDLASEGVCWIVDWGVGFGILGD